jgi:hypothetical protein
MQRIEFSEMTNRLHRNLMIAAALLIGISVFDIRVGKAAASGVELINFTTGVLIAVLLAVLIYHALAFAIRAFEEYRIWELQLAARETTYYSGGVGTTELAHKLRDLGELFEKVISNSGAISSQNQEIIQKNDATYLKEVTCSP